MSAGPSRRRHVSARCAVVIPVASPRIKLSGAFGWLCSTQITYWLDPPPPLQSSVIASNVASLKPSDLSTFVDDASSPSIAVAVGAKTWCSQAAVASSGARSAMEYHRSRLRRQ